MQTKNFAVMWLGWRKRLRFHRRMAGVPTHMYVGPFYIRIGSWK